ncbi:MAG TPA: TraR/DksA C4-type zinc finger protein [Nitrolancea sp.]|nr:TraR/DksA C4-type zinc finger protein [Nitrolancea sp.]
MVVSEDQVNQVRVRLEAQLESTRHDIREIDDQVRTYGADHGSSDGADNHIGDDSDIVYEQEKLLTVREELTDRRSRIEHALKKMDNGTWGICERCGQAIAPERLDALPFVALCITCQELQDRRGDGRR